MKTYRIQFVIAILLLLLNACAVSDLYEKPLSSSDINRLHGIQDGIVNWQGIEKISPGEPAEVQVDRKILEAVRQLVATLKPEYKEYSFRKHRLGFMEISDIEGKKTSRLHKYISEKTLTFSFLQPEIADNINIVERFLLKDVLEELKFQKNVNVIDQKTAKRIGYIYGVDLIETGVITESQDFIDLNLRMVETKRGRIVAVSSVKIEKTEPIRQWFKKVSNGDGFNYEDYMSQ